MGINQTLCLATFAASSLMVLSSARAADEAPGAKLEEIVVTAQRREERLQDVPVAISSLDRETAKALGVDGTASLTAVVPGLDFSRGAGGATPFIRGVGTPAITSGNERPIATYVDGVYISAPVSGLFAFNNIDHVEVLKGPQGTLFGRNATGGVIQVITRTPSWSPSLDAELGYGNFNTVTTNLYATGPLSEAVAADLAVYFNKQNDGWGKNLFTGNDVYNNEEFSVRTKLLAKLGATDITFSADYDRSKDSNGVSLRALPGGLVRLGAGPVYGFPGFYNVNQSEDGTVTSTQGGASVRIEHPLRWAQFVSISAYRQAKGITLYDQDGTPSPALDSYIVARDKMLTEEMQLLSPAGSRVRWIGGIYLLSDNSKYDPLAFPGFQINDTLKTASYAGFGEVTVPLFQGTDLTGGLRYTEDDRRVTGRTLTVTGISQKAEFHKLTYRATLDHKFTTEVMGYVTAARGFKSGLFNLTAPTAPAVRPEVLDSLEAGLKSELLDRRVRLNLAAYHYDYKDLQLNKRLPTGGSALVNAAGAKIDGLDGDLEAIVTPELTLLAGLALMHSKFTDFVGAPCTFPLPTGGNSQPATGCVATGNQLPHAPKATFTIGARYLIRSASGDIQLNANYVYDAGFFWTPDNRLREPAYRLLNASIVWTSPDGRYDARLWGKNLTNDKYDSFVTTGVTGDFASPAPPRTFGLTVGLHWK